MISFHVIQGHRDELRVVAWAGAWALEDLEQNVLSTLPVAAWGRPHQVLWAAPPPLQARGPP